MIKFRKATAREISKIREALCEWAGRDIYREITSGKVVVVGEGKIKEVFLVPVEVYGILNRTKDKRMPYYLGLFFGEINEEFKISLEGLWLISRYSKGRGIIVSEKGEQLFLYGRDILEESIIEVGSFVKLGSKVIIFNKFYEPLGLGVMVKRSDKRTGKPKVIVKNILDRGWYLRKGK